MKEHQVTGNITLDELFKEYNCFKIIISKTNSQIEYDDEKLNVYVLEENNE
jgi:hypothetical protein